MKKLIQFIKGLFVKVDKLEQEVEKLVEESNVSPSVKAKVKKTLKKIDEVENEVKAVVAKAEVVAEVTETPKKKRRYYRPKKK
jgi:hypothetical protein